MEEVEQICGRIIILDRGQVIASGSSKELKKLVSIKEKVTIEFDDISEENINAIKSLKNVASVDVFDNYLYIIYNKGIHNLKELINYMQENKITYKNIFSELPTLNDVFLELTGKELRD